MTTRRVLLDCERLKQPHSGLGQVALNLGKEFLAAPSADWQPVFLLPENRLDIFNQAIDYEIPSWRRRYLPESAPRYDLWHMLHQDANYLPDRNTPYVLTIHDLNFLQEKTPKKANSRLHKVQKLVDSAAAITVISEFTRDVVESHIELNNKTIQVIYNGLSTQYVNTASRPDSHPHGEFLFSLGVVRRKKNFHTLIEFISRLKDVNLVISGNTKGPYCQELLGIAQNSGVADRLVMTGEIDERYKSWLFQNCKAFVFPSLYEGFGLPVLEAMSYGKPIFCAASTSLPEIGGEDVFYWDHFDAEYMADIYHQGLHEFAIDKNRSRRLKERAGTFSWSSAAGQYSRLYKTILSS